MIKKILVPLDGSPLANKILPLVSDLAKKYEAEVTLLHVYFIEFGEPVPPSVTEAIEREVAQCELFLANTAKELQNQGVKQVKIVCLKGSPAREIISYAKNNQIDLIAMSTHGRGEVAWVLGSVAEKVVSHAPVPVLLHRVMEFKLPVFKEEFPPIP